MPVKKNRAMIDRKQAREDTSRLFAYIPILLLFLTSLIFFWQLVNLDFFTPKAKIFDILPISIRAGSVADYSKDLHSIVIPPINEAILNQIITEYPSTNSSQDRFGTLQADLLTPVPTMTLDRRLTAASTPTLLHQTPTPIVVIPTATQFTTPQSTATLYLQPTSTPTLYIQPTSTNFNITSTPRPNPTIPPPVIKTKKPTKTPKK